MGINYNMAIVKLDSNAAPPIVLSMTGEEIARCAQSGIPVILTSYKDGEIDGNGYAPTVKFLTNFLKDGNKWAFDFGDTLTFKCNDLSEYPVLES